MYPANPSPVCSSSRTSPVTLLVLTNPRKAKENQPRIQVPNRGVRKDPFLSITQFARKPPDTPSKLVFPNTPRNVFPKSSGVPKNALQRKTSSLRKWTAVTGRVEEAVLEMFVTGKVVAVGV